MRRGRQATKVIMVRIKLISQTEIDSFSRRSFNRVCNVTYKMQANCDRKNTATTPRLDDEALLGSGYVGVSMGASACSVVINFDVCAYPSNSGTLM